MSDLRMAEMTMAVSPTNEAEVQDIVRAATASATPLRIIGGGTRQAIGRPVNATPLPMAGLSGITLCEPAEMVIGARAGTPLSAVREALAANRQILPFEPMDHRPLLGTLGEPSIGAVAAGNISGSRRLVAGAARDSLIGVRFVNGRGEAIKSGGRVMKNVTGLDLVKLQAGAWGTLGVLTEVIFKVLPQAETSLTLVLQGLGDARGIEALSLALGSPFEVSGAAHLPAMGNEKARTLLRLEGFERSLAYRSKALIGLMKSFGTADILPLEPSLALWRAVTDAVPLAEPRDTAVWRLSVMPGHGPAVVAAIRNGMEARGHFYDWGGGLVWLAVDPAGDAGAAIIRAAVASHGGHATLVRATPAVRATIASFPPEPEAVARLSRAVRASVDPATIFNAGLMG